MAGRCAAAVTGKNRIVVFCYVAEVYVNSIQRAMSTRGRCKSTLQCLIIGDIIVVGCLLEVTCYTNSCAVFVGMRPLHYAAWQGREPPVSLLLDRRSSVNEPAKDGVTPMHLACEHGHYAVVSLVV